MKDFAGKAKNLEIKYRQVKKQHGFTKAIF